MAGGGIREVIWPDLCAAACVVVLQKWSSAQLRTLLLNLSIPVPEIDRVLTRVKQRSMGAFEDWLRHTVAQWACSPATAPHTVPSDLFGLEELDPDDARSLARVLCSLVTTADAAYEGKAVQKVLCSLALQSALHRSPVHARGHCGAQRAHTALALHQHGRSQAGV